MRAKALQTRPAVCTCKNSRCAKNYCECFRNGARRASDPSGARQHDRDPTTSLTTPLLSPAPRRRRLQREVHVPQLREPCGAVKRETKVKLNPNERKAAKAAAAIAAAAEQAAIPGRRPAELDGGGTVGDMALRHSSSFGDMAPAPPPADPLGFAPSTQPRPPPSGLPTQLRTAPSAASLGASTPPMAPPAKPPAERPAPQ